MGKRIIIDKFKDCCSTGADGDDPGTVHGLEVMTGDDATVCGMPICDEVDKYHTTNKPVSCRACIGALEQRGSFRRRAKGWY